MIQEELMTTKTVVECDLCAFQEPVVHGSNANHWFEIVVNEGDMVEQRTAHVCSECASKIYGEWSERIKQRLKKAGGDREQ